MEYVSGDIVLIPFPFAELTNIKARPAVVICTTQDIHHDVVLAAISSVIHPKLSSNEFLVEPGPSNNLRKSSVVKADRIVTLKRENVIFKLGTLTPDEYNYLKKIIQNLMD